MEKMPLMKTTPFVYLIESVRGFRLIQELERLNKETIEMLSCHQQLSSKELQVPD